MPHMYTKRDPDLSRMHSGRILMSGKKTVAVIQVLLQLHHEALHLHEHVS